MHYSIKAPDFIRSSIRLPASKSISNRVLIIRALSGGAHALSNLSESDDTQVMLRALQEMPREIDIRAAGTAMRFLTAYLSLASGTYLLTGTERMRHRPIKLLVDALRTLGARIDYVDEEGYPPLRIIGQPDGLRSDGSVELPGDVSSQYISALLLIGPYLKNGLTLRLTGTVVSKPYIDLTLDLMRRFGAETEWTDEATLTVKPRPYRSVAFTVENDWSAASYWYETVALSRSAETEITLNGLLRDSRQGDREAVRLFDRLGVSTEFDGRTVRLRRTGGLPSRFEYDFANQPDLAQTLVVTCLLSGVPFVFTGLQSLRIKETDRLIALTVEARKLGYVLSEVGGAELRWEGTRCDASTAIIDTYDDHRMAMAFAPASLVVPGIRINHPEVVSKSYPRYWEELRHAGFTIEEG